MSSQSAQFATPDFSSYYGNKRLSDVLVILFEEPAAGASGQTARVKRERMQEHHVVGHGLVLSSFSKYCRTKLEEVDTENDLQDSSKGNSRTVELMVPRGQLEVGQVLIKAMYQSRPDLCNLTQKQLLQLLLLADRYEVAKVQAAALAALSAIPLHVLEWDTAMSVYSLPSACMGLQAYDPLYDMAAAKVRQELGDLELVWADPGGCKQHMLQQLPCPALQKLLQHPSTKVSSEHTVFYTIQQWHRRQQRSESWNQQQTNNLLHLLRMQQCTQLYIATVIGHSQMATACFNSCELMVASSCSSYAKESQLLRAFKQFSDPLQLRQKYPAWLLPQRPLSAMTELSIDWALPLSQLQAPLDRHCQDTARAPETLSGCPKTWQGLSVCPRLCIRSLATGSKAPRPSVVMDLFVGNSGQTPLACYKLHCRYTVQRFGLDNKSYMLYTDVLSGAAECAAKEVIRTGAAAGWTGVASSLKAQKLVGADECLHIKLQVLHVQ